MKHLIFILIGILYLLGNAYVFHRAWVAIPPNTIARTVLIASAIILVSSLFIFFAFSEIMPIGLASFLYKLSTSWLIIFLYLLIFALLKDLIRITPFISNSAINHYTKDNWIGLGLVFIFVSMLMISGYLKYTWKKRVELPIKIEKNIGKSNYLRIVALSDLHLGYGIGKSELLEWIDMINKENPDIVLIAGDIIDNSVRPLEPNKLDECFKKIKAPLGIYSCLGNHEYLSTVGGSMEFFKRAGIHLLRDSAALVDSSFYVVGRDDRMNPHRKPLSELVKDLDSSKPIILLDHQPYKLEEAEQNGIDLQISGHTHKGQVWPISLITDLIYEVSHGYIKKGKTNIYVSSGIGIWGGKFRIGTQSEYIVIDIEKK